MKKRNTAATSLVKKPAEEQAANLIRVREEELGLLKDFSDWARVDALTDAEIEQAIAEDPDAAPSLDETFWRNAKLVDRRRPKTTITMRVDDDVLDYFKAEGPGYQSRMNGVLRAYMFARKERGV